jgi:hypothetical protein
LKPAHHTNQERGKTKVAMIIRKEDEREKHECVGGEGEEKQEEDHSVTRFPGFTGLPF